ncbi:MAG TPA: aminodeoxychorismate lyase, partial [Steroidobacteraceae bacterium]
GEPAHSISALDRGLHYGDGLFETITCCGGRPRFLALHLDRLTESCRRLGIPLEDPSVVRAEVESLASRQDRSVVKVIISRGEALLRGYSYTGSEKPTRISFLFGMSEREDDAVEKGVRVLTSSIRLGESPALAGMKHLSRLEQVIARAQLRGQDASELLMYSSSGKLISGSMGNVFLVREGRLRTPRVDLCGVAGVMRRVVLREAARAGIDVEECELGPADVQSADELFLTNARIGIWPVTAVDSRTLPIGEITRRVQKLLAPLLAEAHDA